MTHIACPLYLQGSQGIVLSPPQTAVASGLFFSQAMACPFLCLLASKDTVSAVSCLLTDQFFYYRAPLAWAALSSLFGCLPRAEQWWDTGQPHTAAPDVGRGVQERISGCRHPVIVRVLGELWGRVAVCG